MSTLGAVLTADIVNSTKLEESHLQQLTENLEQILSTSGVKAYSFYRGDSFQSYFEDPGQALRVAFRLRTQVLLSEGETGTSGLDLKASIGIAETKKPVQEINKAQGMAFVLSGRGLEFLEKTGRRLLIQSEVPALNLAFETMSLFGDHLFSHITTKQAEVLQHLLLNRSQQEIARELNKYQSTISGHVQALGWPQLEQLLNIYTQGIQQLCTTDGE